MILSDQGSENDVHDKTGHATHLHVVHDCFPPSQCVKISSFHLSGIQYHGD